MAPWSPADQMDGVEKQREFLVPMAVQGRTSIMGIWDNGITLLTSWREIGRTENRVSEG